MNERLNWTAQAVKVVDQGWGLICGSKFSSKLTGYSKNSAPCGCETETLSSWRLFIILCHMATSTTRQFASWDQWKRVPTALANLQGLMPDDLRWSWCNNFRNNIHNESNTVESSWTPPPQPFHGKLPSTKLVPGAKKVGDCCTRIYKANQGWITKYILYTVTGTVGDTLLSSVEEKS